jgi:hypothetical protein
MPRRGRNATLGPRALLDRRGLHFFSGGFARENGPFERLDTALESRLGDWVGRRRRLGLGPGGDRFALHEMNDAAGEVPHAGNDVSEPPRLNKDLPCFGLAVRAGVGDPCAAHVEARTVAELGERTEDHEIRVDGARAADRGRRIRRRLGAVSRQDDIDPTGLFETSREHLREPLAQVGRFVGGRVDHHRQHRYPNRLRRRA